MKRFVYLLLVTGCAAITRQGEDAGTSQDASVGGNVQFATGCGKEPVFDPHTLCVGLPNVMTFEPDGGDCGSWEGAVGCEEPSVMAIVVPESCWSTPTCACLEAAGITVCPISGTVCQDYVSPTTQLYCGCSGSCCLHRSDGASIWTCACKNLDGTPWCMNSAKPQTCTDTPDGALCAEVNSGQ